MGVLQEVCKTSLDAPARPPTAAAVMPLPKARPLLALIVTVLFTSAEALLSRIAPRLIVTLPVKPLPVPSRTSRPLPFFVMPDVPLIAPTSVSGEFTPTLNVAAPLIVVAPLIVTPVPVVPSVRLNVSAPIDNEGN